MRKFYLRTKGTGKTNMVLLNGWGINSKIWSFMIQELDFFLNFI